ncbi:acetolactate decarboxylase [Paraburkholderia sp. MM5477-R1]|uniref:acetolactate decarboxylase n=1 Tax=Paraburkholderia sp. MM5477-R1 TaxID=2991062 RepID=UPI003D1AD79C
METTVVCSCVQQVAKSFAYPTKIEADSELNEIYQTSLMSALIDGVYDGNMTIADLLEHGDFGLGTFNDLDGEFVAFDSKVHQLRGDGSARVAAMDQKTPFAVMTHFRPTVSGELMTALDKCEVQGIIDKLVGSPNLFCAFRIAGRFVRVETRTVQRQTKPYRPMLQAIERQPVFKFEETAGTLIGFRCPPYVQGINVAGFHVHYITDDRRGGGHVLDYRLLEGKLEIAKISKLRIDLPQTDSFQQATLHSKEMSKAIEAAEG